MLSHCYNTPIHSSLNILVSRLVPEISETFACFTMEKTEISWRVPKKITKSPTKIGLKGTLLLYTMTLDHIHQSSACFALPNNKEFCTLKLKTGLFILPIQVAMQNFYC